MQKAYLLSGISFVSLFRLLWRKHFSCRFFGRVLFLLQGSLWSSLFKWIETFTLPGNLPVIKQPVFVVGHWRTGSTFLHQLLALNPDFVSPSVLQVSVPESFSVSEPYFRRIMSHVMEGKRPMDNVRLTPGEPQEDEYALLKMLPETPLEALLFPAADQPFCDRLTHAIQNEQLNGKWTAVFHRFAQKLLVQAPDKKLLFKNPFHSFRIHHLIKQYPDALFIHIHRHPLEVIPSTVHMWNVVGPQNMLKGKWSPVSLKEAIPLFNYLTAAVRKHFDTLSSSSRLEVSYVDLDQDPLELLRVIYDHFGWDFSFSYQKKLQAFLASLSTYKKNLYSLSEEERSIIERETRKFTDHYYPSKEKQHEV